MAYYDGEILKQNLGKALNEFEGLNVPISEVAIKIGHAIKNTPPADVVEVKHGMWKNVVVYNDTCIATCSNCRRQIVERECNATAFKLENEFCRKCGAKMDGGKAE